MKYEELQAQLTQAKDHNRTGNFVEAERFANKLLAELDNAEHSPSMAEGVAQSDGVVMLKCSVLLALAESAGRKGEYDSSLARASTSLDLAVKHNLPQNIANAQNAIGVVCLNLGTYDKALECFHKALAALEELGDKSGVANVTGNIGNVYASLGTYDKALEYYHKALAAHEELGEKSRIANVTGNIGIVYKNLSTYDKALEYYHKALAAYEELGAKSGVATVTGNIGNVYHSLGTYDKVIEYLYKALDAHEELGDKSGVAGVTGNIGNLFFDKKYEGYDAAKAEEYYLKAIAISTKIGYKHHLFTVHKSLFELYENENRWEDALVHYKKHIAIKDEVNVEEVKKQESIREQRKAIELAKAAAEARHQATQELLHNVLPPSIAHRIIAGEKLIAEKLPSVSVLFADIVNFTKLSQRITAEELVEGLDRIFSSFDTLAEKHGLEKIKTIGDAYMVVAGAPEPRTDHAEAMAEFALDMVEAMKEFTSKTTGEKIQLRIGIHSGEVVAGVIGKKKFAYDLWGDAVNTASRMESHGEAGKIHISDDFRIAVETCRGTSLHTIKIIERGEMDIKGKGMMKTYYLQKANL